MNIFRANLSFFDLVVLCLLNTFFLIDHKDNYDLSFFLLLLLCNTYFLFIFVKVNKIKLTERTLYHYKISYGIWNGEIKKTIPYQGMFSISFRGGSAFIHYGSKRPQTLSILTYFSSKKWRQIISYIQSHKKGKISIKELPEQPTKSENIKRLLSIVYVLLIHFACLLFLPVFLSEARTWETILFVVHWLFFFWISKDELYL
ncbi:hypothetical protein [Aneurinibacillus sp. REN35]|uniref:hypothetical protein n=1 Tax=Aneurinibacillus sp. REN35 TaxID=3237286 RepID=UPI003527F9D7